MTPKQHLTVAERCQKALIEHTAGIISTERSSCVATVEAWLQRAKADDSITAVAALGAIIAELEARKSFD